ncbi:MAG: hypothetical protein AB7G87_00865 [Clostridia bacterium]
MDDRLYDLLEKVYIELQEVKTDVKENQKHIKENEKHIKENQKHILRFEDNFSNKVSALFDAQSMTNERLDRIEQKVDTLSEKAERHEVEIRVIEGIRKKA